MSELYLTRSLTKAQTLNAAGLCMMYLNKSYDVEYGVILAKAEGIGKTAALAVVDEEGNLRAFANYLTSLSDKEDSAFLLQMVVLPEERHAGLAARMLGEIADDCICRGLSRLDLTTTGGKENSFYSRMGFACVGQDCYSIDLQYLKSAASQQIPQFA